MEKLAGFKSYRTMKDIHVYATTPLCFSELERGLVFGTLA